MAVAVNKVAQQFLNVRAGVAIPVAMQVFEASDVRVIYGITSRIAVQNVDYTISLANDFNTFTIVPTASLIAKINALIAANPSERNYITVRRELDLLTESTSALARYTPFTSREHDRSAMRDQQLSDRLNRSLQLGERFVTDRPLLTLAELEPNRVLIVDPTGTQLIAGPNANEIKNAQAYAAAAAAAAAEAEAAASLVEELNTLAEAISGPADARKRVVANSAGTGYVLADRFKRFIFAYSQSNIAIQGIGETWRYPPPPNLFVWNGGFWNGDMTPPLGDAFVSAASMPPMIGIAYAAELARQFPEDDFYLVMVARGGTSIRALAGMRYRWRSATSDAVASGDIRMGPGNGQVVYNDVDLTGYVRMSGLTDLGVSSFYPARIQSTLDGGASWIEFTCNAAFTDGGDWRSQPTTVTGSANWPPPNGTDVTVFPALPRMRNVVNAILPAAMTAAGLTGSQRRIDKMLIWPTESDLNYWDAYEGRDYGFIADYLAAYVTPDTDEVTTMPWPYGVGIEANRADWWNALRRITAAEAGRRTLIDLSATGANNWGDDNTPGALNSIHVLRRALETVGTYIRKSEASGGVAPVIATSGQYTPAITGIANVDSVNISEAMWFRIGQVVKVTGNVSIDATASATETTVSISLPIMSDMVDNAQLGGVAVSRHVDHPAASIIGDAATDTARMSYKAPNTSGTAWWFDFSYSMRGA